MAGVLLASKARDNPKLYSLFPYPTASSAQVPCAHAGKWVPHGSAVVVQRFAHVALLFANFTQPIVGSGRFPSRVSPF